MLPLSSIVTMAAFQMSPLMSPSNPGWLTWAAARDHCASLGMELAAVKSAAEQAALNAALSELEPENTVHGVMIWIGARASSAPADAAGFAWLDGTPVGSFANWREGTPNGPGLCVTVYQHKGQYVWNNVACTGTRSFACSDGLPHPPIAPSPPRPPAPPPSPPPPSASSAADGISLAVIFLCLALFVFFDCLIWLAILGFRRCQGGEHRPTQTVASAQQEIAVSQPAIAVTQPDGLPAVARKAGTV